MPEQMARLVELTERAETLEARKVAALERIAAILAAEPVRPQKTGDELNMDSAQQCPHLRELMKESRASAEEAQHANGELDRVEKERDAAVAELARLRGVLAAGMAAVVFNGAILASPRPMVAEDVPFRIGDRVVIIRAADIEWVDK